jgi:hypothetical protein
VKVHVFVSPLRIRTVDAVPTHAAEAVSQAEIGSQVSPASSTLLLQAGLQSLSMFALQPEGQHPSLFTHAVWVPAERQEAWQVPGLAKRKIPHFA